MLARWRWAKLRKHLLETEEMDTLGKFLESLEELN